MAEQTELSFVLGWDEPDSVIADFIRCVGNGGLARYKTIFQTGAKHGEPVYSHVLNMVFTAERLQPILNLSDAEIRVLYSSIPPHDLNKVVQGPKVSFNRLATLKTVREELERLNIPEFFPDYLDYLEDITLLIRSHSGHFHTAGEFLIPTHNPYRLDRNRLDHVLRPLIRALDNLQLSNTLTERTNKQDFLSFLNSITYRQYEFGHHHIAENRGILTNLIHNQVANYFEEQYGFIPLLFYPDGVAYLVEKGQTPRITAVDLAKIGKRVALVCAHISRGNFAKFIRPSNQGIKVNRQCLELKTPLVDIWSHVHTLVMRKVAAKHFKVEEKERKVRERLQTVLNGSEYLGLRPRIERRLRSPMFPSSPLVMGAGELLGSFYIFLSDHLTKQVGDPWRYLYRWLKIRKKAALAFYNLLDPRYQRAYVIAGDKRLSIEKLQKNILATCKQMIREESQEKNEALGDFVTLGDYLPRIAKFSFETEQQVDFAAALQVYITNNHYQCCSCGSEFKAEELMKQYVADDIAVQTFSNRLPGAWAKEPKRNICSVCCAQFILEKLNRQAARKIKKSGGKSETPGIFYLHLFPYTFYTDIFFRSLWDGISDLLATDTSVVLLRSDEALRKAVVSQSVPLRFLTQTSKGKPFPIGLSLPQHSELVGNALIFPFICPGQNDAEQFLFALQNALVVQRFFGCKALLSLSPVPPIDRDNFGDLFVDGIPLGFEGLLPHPAMNRSELENLWTQMATLARLRTELYNPEREQNVMLVLSRAMGDSTGLTAFYEADRLVEAKAGAGGAHGEQRMWRAIAITRRILSDVNILAKGGSIMQALQELAEMAWRDRILGRSLERNSRLKPFDMILEALTGKSDAFGLDTVKAALVEDIFRHLEVIARPGYEPGRPKREKVKAYVDWFFKSILDEVYRGNVNRLLNDEKGLRSAYLFYFTEQIPMKEHAEAASTVQSTN